MDGLKRADKAKTLGARRATALYGIEMALTALPLTRNGRLADRLFVLNAALDAFTCGMFDLAVVLASDAIKEPIHASLPDDWPHPTLEETAQRLDAISRNRLH